MVSRDDDVRAGSEDIPDIGVKSIQESSGYVRGGE
jgi:hypothetical protein